MYIEINGKKIGAEYPTYFIADVGANHDGDLERAKDLIYLAAEKGADAVKFQHFKAETIVSDYGFKNMGDQKSHQASWGKSVFDVYKDASINTNWNETLVETCKNANIDFFTSPYSLDLVDEVDQYLPAYKIGSGDITWIEIAQYIAKKNKPVLLAAGASTFDDVTRAADAILKINPQLLLMQCNTNYTASLDNFKYIQLNVLISFKQMYPNLPLGLSDHTPGHATVLGAVALGARAIEKHFTDDNLRDGPDHKFAMNPSSWKEMVDRTRELEYALGTGVKKVEDNEADTVVLQRRSIRLKKDIKKGTLITKDLLEYLRPCPKDALAPFQSELVIGKHINKDCVAGEHLAWNLLQ